MSGAEKVRDRDKRAPEFAPNDLEELLLKKINDILRDSNLETYCPNKLDILPPLIFVSFVPRSGSTYLAQLLARSTKFHYISNFLARFWLRPDIGFFLQAATGLADLQQPENESLISRYGVTSHPLDPHEFGFFWRQFITGDVNDFVSKPYDPVSVEKLRMSLNDIRACSSKPMFVKNGLAGYNVELIKHCFPEAKFIYVKRDIGQVAKSIYKARTDIFGSPSEWLSIRPANIAKLQALENPLDQIYGQIKAIDQHINSAFYTCEAEFLSVDYTNLVADPAAAINQIYSFAMQNKIVKHL